MSEPSILVEGESNASRKGCDRRGDACVGEGTVNGRRLVGKRKQSFAWMKLCCFTSSCGRTALNTLSVAASGSELCHLSLRVEVPRDQPPSDH